MPSEPITTSLGSDQYNFPLSFYNRPTLALDNLLKADLDASVKAILTPESLSPSQREKIRKTFSRDPIMDAIVEVATNPIVIIGTIISLLYPPLAAGQVFNFAAQAGGVASRLSLAARFLSTPLTIFRGRTKLVNAMLHQVSRTSKFKHDFGIEMLGKSYENFKHVVGRAPNIEEVILASLKRDGADDAANFLNKSISSLGRKKLGINIGSESLLKKELDLPSKVKRGISGLANDWKRIDDKMYQDLPKKFLEEVATHLEASGLSTRHFYSRSPFTDKVMHGTPKKKLGKLVDKYFPHQIINSRGLRDLSPVSKAGFEESTMKFEYIYSRSLLSRQGFSMPFLDDLVEVEKHLNPRALQILKEYPTRYRSEIETKILPLIGRGNEKAAIKKILKDDYNLRDEVANGLGDQVQQLSQAGKVEEATRFMQSKFNSIGQVPQYSLRGDRVMSQHINSFAYQHAWRLKAPGASKSVGQVIEEEAALLKRTDTQRYRILSDDYIPMLRGMKTWKEQERQIIFSDFKLKLSSSLQTPRMKNLLDSTAPGKAIRRWMVETLGSAPGSASTQSFSSSLTSLFYHGALGFNPSPALKNTLQPLITTANVIGMPSTLRGVAKLMPKMNEYARRLKFYLRSKKGLSFAQADDKAMWDVFRPFQEENLAGHPMLGDVLEESIPMIQKGFQKVLAGGKQASMAMFHTTERFNRLLTFEGSFNKAILDGLTHQESQKFASMMVRMTQFPGGPMGIPHGMLGVSGPLRQFTQFPLRMLDFMYSSLRFGSAEAVAAGKMPFNLGTIARTARNSAIAATLAQRALGLNIDNALLFGALPAPLSEKSPFFPFPLVSPALSVAGSVGGAVFTGDFSRVPSSLAVGVPGGIAFRRAYNTLAPTKADYKNRDTEGRISVMDKTGKLVGKFTPAQLFMRSIGLRTTNVEAERQFTEYILKQREILRQFRTEYLSALQSNNIETAQDIQSTYQEKYPELPPLRVKKSDIKALRLRSQTTRIQRILKSLPADVRPLFEEIASVSVASEAARLVENGGDSIQFLLPPTPPTAGPTPLRPQ